MSILIVDDSTFVVLFCQKILKKSGYSVMAEAFDGEQAVEQALRLKPDLVLMDIALPKKNGFECTQDILKIHPQTRIIAMSSLDENWVRKQDEKSAFFDFIPKPIDKEELIRKVKRVGFL